MHFEGVAGGLLVLFVPVRSFLRGLIIIIIIKLFNKCCDFNKRMTMHFADVLAVDL